MISLAQAADYIARAIGADAGEAMLQAALDDVGALEQAMIDAGYSASTRTRLQLLGAAVLALPGDAVRAVGSGTASGASRTVVMPKGQLSAMRSEIGRLDVAGIMVDVIGADPEAPAPFVFSGCGA